MFHMCVNAQTDTFNWSSLSIIQTQTDCIQNSPLNQEAICYRPPNHEFSVWTTMRTLG